MPFTFEDSMIHCMILQFTPRTTVCCILYRFHLSSMIALHVLALRHFLSHNPHILPLYVHALHVDCGVPLPEPYVWDPILSSTWQLHELLIALSYTESSVNSACILTWFSGGGSVVVVEGFPSSWDSLEV